MRRNAVFAVLLSVASLAVGMLGGMAVSSAIRKQEPLVLRNRSMVDEGPNTKVEWREEEIYDRDDGSAFKRLDMRTHRNGRIVERSIITGRVTEDGMRHGRWHAEPTIGTPRSGPSDTWYWHDEEISREEWDKRSAEPGKYPCSLKIR